MITTITSLSPSLTPQTSSPILRQPHNLYNSLSPPAPTPSITILKHHTISFTQKPHHPLHPKRNLQTTLLPPTQKALPSRCPAGAAANASSTTQTEEAAAGVAAIGDAGAVDRGITVARWLGGMREGRMRGGIRSG